jgi:hypothetical protein
MTIKIPKELRGFAYDRVMPIEMNTFNVDVLLPSVFFKVVSDGQSWGRLPNDSTKIGDYVTALAGHPHVSGFEGPEGARLLNRLVRTSLVEISRRGTSKVEQIESVTAYTLLAFKPGFPVHHSNTRRVETLIHRMMADQVRGGGSLRALFEHIFGDGLTLRGGAEPNGTYDGQTELDTLTLLSIAFLDGFAPTGIRPVKERPSREACPAVAGRMARDLRRYLEAYRDRMPIEALTYHLKALINFELFSYSLHLFNAVVELVEEPNQLPAAMRQPLQPASFDVYLDFTGAATGLSREMAAACVRRDLELVNRFVRANLTLRQLDRYAHRLRGDRRVGQLVGDALADDEGGPAFLQSLLLLLDEPAVSFRIDAAAQHDEDLIHEANAIDARENDDESERQHHEATRIAEPAESDFERIILLLDEGQRTGIARNVTQWYWSVGGLQKPHGIMTGSLRSRQSWRYAPSNDLLATLVQLAAVDIPRWDKDEPAPQPIRLQEFLEWLEMRFGIVIDRPSEGFAGADYVAAAQENLRAMLRRLRQMGVFRDLSDDFTVQRLIPPYASAAEEGVFA